MTLRRIQPNAVKCVVLMKTLQGQAIEICPLARLADSQVIKKKVGLRCLLSSIADYVELIGAELTDFTAIGSVVTDFGVTGSTLR